MTVRINLKRAERKVLPEGDYLLNIDKCQQMAAKGSKEQKLHIEFLPDPETHPDVVGVRLYHDMSLLEQSWFRVVELYTAAIGEPQAVDEEGNFDFDPEDLQSAQVAAQVFVDDTYDGIPRNKIGQFYSAAEFGKEPMEEAALA